MATKNAAGTEAPSKANPPKPRKAAKAATANAAKKTDAKKTATTKADATKADAKKAAKKRSRAKTRSAKTLSAAKTAATKTRANPAAKETAAKGTATTATKRAAAGARWTKPDEVVLLSGGNPQIPKGDGDAPVQAYIAAMPGWKRDIGRQLDALIVRTVPNLRKAVRWNSPFYGVEGQGWFLGIHCFTKYIKLTFLRGTALRPLPPVGSKDPNTRYFHIHEGEALDEALLTSWLEQAAAMPGDPFF